MFFSWEDSVFYPCHQVCSLSDCQRSFFLKHFHSINDRTLALYCGSVKILSKLTGTYSKEVWFKNKALVCHKVSGSIPCKSVLGICIWIDVECESRWALLIIKSREEWESTDGATWWYPDQSESGALQLVIRYFTILQTSTDPHNQTTTNPHNQTTKQRHDLQNPSNEDKLFDLIREQGQGWYSTPWLNIHFFKKECNITF